MYLAMGGDYRTHQVLSLECSQLNNMQNATVSCANFLISSCSRERRYQALPAFPHYKQQKARWSLGKRLDLITWAAVFGVTMNCIIFYSAVEAPCPAYRLVEDSIRIEVYCTDNNKLSLR